MTDRRPPTGVLLLQLGTPDSTSIPDVRSYLRQFLSDPRVLDMPRPVRSVLLNAVILPFRPRRSAEQYEKIWTEEGSPLTIHTRALTEKVRGVLGDGFRVEMGMRYKNPPIEEAVERLFEAGCDPIVILPLFPQYASAAGGSAAERAIDIIASHWNVPSTALIASFHDDPGFIRSVAAVARPELDAFGPDHILFSYHGLPEKHVRKSDRTGSWCLASESCCDAVTDVNLHCYRAQSFATTRLLAAELGLGDGTWSTSFQSRLAGQKWIEPYTDGELPSLYGRGVRRLAVLTPSFTADCLETIEEIGIRGRGQWSELGGTDFLLVSCVNSDDRWAAAVAELVMTAR